jgi:hypothetical protein
VPGPDHHFLTAVLYGPVPGVELIPYFLGLLAWVGVAIAAILLAPIRALIRRLRKIGRNPPSVPIDESTIPVSVHPATPPAGSESEPMPAAMPESSDEGSRDRQ